MLGPVCSLPFASNRLRLASVEPSNSSLSAPGNDQASSSDRKVDDYGSLMSVKRASRGREEQFLSAIAVLG